MSHEEGEGDVEGEVAAVDTEEDAIVERDVLNENHERDAPEELAIEPLEAGENAAEHRLQEPASTGCAGVIFGRTGMRFADDGVCALDGARSASSKRVFCSCRWILSGRMGPVEFL